MPDVVAPLVLPHAASPPASEQVYLALACLVQPWSARALRVLDVPQAPGAPPGRAASSQVRQLLLLGPQALPPVPRISRLAQQVSQPAVRASLAKACQRALAQAPGVREPAAQRWLAPPACWPQPDGRQPQA